MSQFKMMARRLLPYVVLFLVAQTAIRLGLALYSREALAAPGDWITPFATGLWFDLAVALIALPVFAVFPLLLPKGWAGGRLDKSVAFIAFAVLVLAMIIQGIAEFFFWEEFTTRFNFIAVDYLIYTQEVIGNILESYPVFPLLGAAVATSLGLAWLMRKPVLSGLANHPAFPARLAAFAVFAGLGLGGYAVTSKAIVDPITNPAAQELGSNGLYNFVYAFFNNEIEFRKFYPTIDDNEARTFVASHFSNLTGSKDSVIERHVIAKAPFQRKNVIQITMESMNADFMAAFGSKSGLTPNLDRLAGEGLFFANMRATGTRTVRGLEALALSVPPTPGQSMLRRPGSGNRFTLGGVFQDAGYETKFLYGGHGYFDNMNGFFSENGYGIGDQGDMAAEDIEFANAWGVSDEDLFKFTMKQADEATASGKNFFFTVMTTSNHRPFTYPNGKIDIPSPGGRDGAVKYSDYAIGQLVKLAAEKPWFKDTVFVFVADHTDSVAGKEELDFNRYHIPCIVWSPGFIQQQRIDHLASQIDVAPTVLGLLSASYTSRFYGVDLLNETADDEVFISNYEKVAMLEDDTIAVLEPVSQVRQYRSGKRVDQSEMDEALNRETISWYQVASDWRAASERVPSGVR